MISAISAASHSSVSKSVLEETLVKDVLESLIRIGVKEFCLCPSSRNAPLVYPLLNSPQIKLYTWPEERSAAFFALGRIKASGRPVAVVTTSGTAVGELLPAVMEAYYSGLPLVLVTADRPRRFRGTGAPQSAEQVGIFSHYLHGMKDLEPGDSLSFDDWAFQGPLQLNVCLEDPKDENCREIRLKEDIEVDQNCTAALYEEYDFTPDDGFIHFLDKIHYPLVIVGALHPSYREAAVQFLLQLNAPIYAEAPSGIREESRLAHLQIRCVDQLRLRSIRYHYPIDGILRLGSIPTLRFWRDLEELSEEIEVYSISDLPFSGLSTTGIKQTNLPFFLKWASTQQISRKYSFSEWHEADKKVQAALHLLFEEEPLAEPSLVHALSKKISRGSKIYLGNSMPIREWDLGAEWSDRSYQIAASRGVNGIDGQLATFLGFSSVEQDNWALLGDLTTLYDMVAPWITNQLADLNINFVVINNGGGAIFSRMFSHPAFQNSHTLSFKPLAQFWGWKYEKWEVIPERLFSSKGARLIELTPHPKATERFWKSFSLLIRES